MENQYPYIQCLNPRRIYNKYIKDYIIVPCEHCKACLCRKGSRNALKCRLESTAHKYTFFITLTYNQVSLPLMRWINYRVSDYRYTKLYELCPRLRNRIGHAIENNILSDKDTDLDLPPYELHELLEKCSTFNLLPHLSIRDAQLFIKRLRKYISKYSNEKVRYYLVGEYGMQHYRPHYHLLLWFSDDKIFKIIQQAVSACWKYGRLSTEVPRGDCSKYVAKYVASNCELPRVFMQNATKPFCIHSQHLGESVLEKTREEVYESSAKDFNKRCFPFSDGDKNFSLWRSLKTTFFPKCKGFVSLDDSQLYYVYRLYASARNWTKTANVARQARYILSTILGVGRVYQSTCQFHGDPDINDLLMYFYKSADINICALDMYKEYWSRIYMELRLSRHFLRFVCNHTEDPHVTMKMIQRIKQYWSECEMDSLNEQYKIQESMDFDSEEEYKYFYHNLSWDEQELTETKQYKVFQANVNDRWNNSLKHKKLNSLNKDKKYVS